MKFCLVASAPQTATLATFAGKYVALVPLGVMLNDVPLTLSGTTYVPVPSDVPELPCAARHDRTRERRPRAVADRAEHVERVGVDDQPRSRCPRGLDVDRVRQVQHEPLVRRIEGRVRDDRHRHAARRDTRREVDRGRGRDEVAPGNRSLLVDVKTSTEEALGLLGINFRLKTSDVGPTFPSITAASLTSTTGVTSSSTIVPVACPSTTLTPPAPVAARLTGTVSEMPLSIVSPLTETRRSCWCHPART